MFTGIIEEVGRLRSLGGGTIDIEASKVLSDAHIGDSICVNGICLTVTSFTPDHFTADVMPETVRRTSLAELTPGSLVNLERALLPTTRLGGHIVSGHIDGTGKILSLRAEGNALLLQVGAGPDILRGIVEKGSVALDGISLTVAAVTEADFTVSLIPHTREVTNLREKRLGDLLDIETDILGKYAMKLMRGQSIDTQAEPQEVPLTQEFLLENGF